MQFILDTLIESLENKLTIVLIGIVRSSGSAPRTSGARMLVRRDGSISGTIGGGLIEGKCIEKAQELLTGSLEHAEINFSLTASTVASEGMVCGGDVTVLLQKINDQSLDLFVQMQEAVRNGSCPKFVTVLPSNGQPPESLVFSNQVSEKLGVEFAAKVNKKRGRTPFLVQSDKGEIFVEPLVSHGVVYLLGAGHVALATAQLAEFTDFEVIVVDDREEFANRQRYPIAREVRVVPSFDDCLGQLSSDDYVVIVTRGHLYDKEVLAQALRTKAGYIGMIGSRKKRNVVYQALLEDGFCEMDLKRVYSPIGLSIGADTPNEIALSIVSELVKVRSEAG